MKITGDEKITRDFTYVDDVVEGCLRAGCFPELSGHTIEIGTGIETPIKRLSEIINDITGNQAEIIYEEMRSWDNVYRRCASVEKARSLLDFSANVKLETGLKHTVEWFQRNWEQIKNSAFFT